MPMNGRTDSQEWCDDCEGARARVVWSPLMRVRGLTLSPAEFGHALENCPLANEIF